MEKFNGYVVCNYENTGMLEICRDDETFICKDDEEAVQRAMEDGIKIIPVEQLPANFERKYLGWIDTPGNRFRIYKYCMRFN